MWELDRKEGWAPKNWYFWTAGLEKTVESPLDCKKIKLVDPKGNQSWVFIGRTDAEAEAPIFWPPDVKNWLIGKDPDAGKDWRQEERGTTEDEMVGWHHRLDGRKFEHSRSCWWTGNLGVLQSIGCKESDTTERLNWAVWTAHGYVYAFVYSLFCSPLLSAHFALGMLPSMRVKNQILIFSNQIIEFIKQTQYTQPQMMPGFWFYPF